MSHVFTHLERVLLCLLAHQDPKRHIERRKSVPGAMGQICYPHWFQINPSSFRGITRLIPLSSSKETARFPAETKLLCILLPGCPSRTLKGAARLSQPVFYNPILLRQDPRSNKRMACLPPRAWNVGSVVERRGRTASHLSCASLG